MLRGREIRDPRIGRRWRHGPGGLAGAARHGRDAAERRQRYGREGDPMLGRWRKAVPAGGTGPGPGNSQRDTAQPRGADAGNGLQWSYELDLESVLAALGRPIDTG